MPYSEPLLEQELWFSSLVEIRTPQSVFFYPSVGELLRSELEQVEREAVRKILTEPRTQETRPELVQLEEELIWLSSQISQGTNEALTEKLREIAKAVHGQKRPGLARWVLGAASRIPEVAALPSMVLLRGVSQARLFEGRVSLDREELAQLPVEEQKFLATTTRYTAPRRRARESMMELDLSTSAQHVPVLVLEILDFPSDGDVENVQAVLRELDALLSAAARFFVPYDEVW
jgi:hypothetical protein